MNIEDTANRIESPSNCDDTKLMFVNRHGTPTTFPKPSMLERDENNYFIFARTGGGLSYFAEDARDSP